MFSTKFIYDIFDKISYIYGYSHVFTREPPRLPGEKEARVFANCVIKLHVWEYYGEFGVLVCMFGCVCVGVCIHNIYTFIHPRANLANLYIGKLFFTFIGNESTKVIFEQFRGYCAAILENVI